MGPARLPSYLVTNSILCLLDLMLSTVYISNSTSFAEVWIFLFWIFLPTHSPVSTGWRSRSIFSLRWRQSSIVHWTVRLHTSWLQTCAVCLTGRPDDACGHHSPISSMSASRSAQLLETDRLLWPVLDYGTVCHQILLCATYCHGSVENSKHLRSDSHILLLCFSFYREMHFSAKRGIAIACRLSLSLWRWWIVIT